MAGSENYIFNISIQRVIFIVSITGVARAHLFLLHIKSNNNLTTSPDNPAIFRRRQTCCRPNQAPTFRTPCRPAF